MCSLQLLTLVGTKTVSVHLEGFCANILSNILSKKNESYVFSFSTQILGHKEFKKRILTVKIRILTANWGIMSIYIK